MTPEVYFANSRGYNTTLYLIPQCFIWWTTKNNKSYEKVKRVITAFLLLFIGFLGCKKNENASVPLGVSPEVTNLSKSDAINRNSSRLATFGTLDYANAVKKTITSGSTDSAIFIVVPITFKGKVVASLEAVQIPKGKLPNGDNYALNLLDFKEFDLKTLTGRIEMLDVNLTTTSMFTRELM